MTTKEGLLTRIKDLDFRTQNHYTLEWSDTPADEYEGYKILIQERQRKAKEDDKKQRQQQGN